MLIISKILSEDNIAANFILILSLWHLS